MTYEIKQTDEHADYKANIGHKRKNKNCIDLWNKRLKTEITVH